MFSRSVLTLGFAIFLSPQSGTGSPGEMLSETEKSFPTVEIPPLSYHHISRLSQGGKLAKGEPAVSGWFSSGFRTWG